MLSEAVKLKPEEKIVYLKKIIKENCSTDNVISAKSIIEGKTGYDSLPAIIDLTIPQEYENYIISAIKQEKIEICTYLVSLDLYPLSKFTINECLTLASKTGSIRLFKLVKVSTDIFNFIPYFFLAIDSNQLDFVKYLLSIKPAMESFIYHPDYSSGAITSAYPQKIKHPLLYCLEKNKDMFNLILPYFANDKNLLQTTILAPLIRFIRAITVENLILLHSKGIYTIYNPEYFTFAQENPNPEVLKFFIKTFRKPTKIEDTQENS